MLLVLPIFSLSLIFLPVSLYLSFYFSLPLLISFLSSPTCLFLFVCLLSIYRWLQPDRSVDPGASELNLTSTDKPQVGKQCEFHICTKDQDGKVAFVEGMNVSQVFNFCVTVT